MKSRVFLLLFAIALSSAVIAAEPARKQGAVAAKPLTYANVVAFFKESKLHPIKVQKRCTVFFEGEFKTPDNYNYCLVIVENSDEDLQVTFYFTDAHEMNWVTEFLDASFFSRPEMNRLFEFMNSRRDVRAERVGRFKVDFHKWEPRHAQILVFSFSVR